MSGIKVASNVPYKDRKITKIIMKDGGGLNNEI